MGYVTIENFAAGVDRSRTIASTAPGALWLCKNAHITPGGDIEKRKAFVDQGAFHTASFGLVAAGGALYTFGSESGAGMTHPPGVNYVRLQHPAGYPMTAVLSIELFDGAPYVVAEFSDGSVMHFYNGALVTDWSDGVVRADMANTGGIASHLAALIDAHADYSATVALAVVTITAATPGTAFTITTEAENGGSVNDQTAAVATPTPNVAAVAGVAAKNTIRVTDGDATGTVSSIMVNGVEVLGSAVTWTTSHFATCGAIASQINDYVGALPVSAQVDPANANGVQLFMENFGTFANGYGVEATTTATMRVNDQAAAGTVNCGTMSGGVDAVSAVAQVSTVTIGGTFDPGDRFSVVLNGTIFGNKDKPFAKGRFVKTHKTKLYSPAGATVFFCGVNAPLGWSSSEDPGAGYISVSNHDSGSEVNLALETYLGLLAILSENNAQLWAMEADDALNRPQQFLAGAGTMAPRSLREYGGNDTLYLHHSGIRSLRSRSGVDTAFVNDTGTGIDKLVLEKLAGIPPSEQADAVSFLDPAFGRFLMAVGRNIFVLSHFPQKKISAWSHYELTFRPQWFAKIGNRTYARSAVESGQPARLYLYGGTSGNEYDACVPEIQLPFLGANKEGTFKQWTGIDLIAEGEWEVTALVDPNNLSRYTDLGTLSDYTILDGLAATDISSPVIAPRLINRTATYATISKVICYYDAAEVKG